MSESRSEPKRPRPSASSRRSRGLSTAQLRGPALIVVAVVLVAVVGFVSTRKGPFKVGGSGGPVAVAAAGVSAAPSVSASPVDLGEDDLYPDPDPSASMTPALDDPDAAGPVPSPSTRPSAFAPSPSAATPRWSQVIDELSRLRVKVFEDPTRGDLSAADRPQSQAFRADDAARAMLAAQNLRAKGLLFSLLTVRVLSQRDPVVVLDVVDRVSAYSIVDAQGRTVESRPARGPKQWRMTIRRDQGRWRFVEIVAATKGR